ncbi:winged helix-turn-helix transcriptional regulator [Nocardia jinanensis]|uniref:Transcriptional regulator n=1 Tax=Nocardia jinanensis TaxID=382504 RepID=A0A917RD04_9NOCA|nr:hypothetical protein [Nocardia jinanensis]GGL01947.1 hypothetical protein GCM10011588_15860 [Nocardia jinanensis]
MARLRVRAGGPYRGPGPYRAEGQRERFEYRPTEKARELYPVIVGLMQWGERHLTDPAGPAVRLVDGRTGTPVSAAAVPAGSPTCEPKEIAVVPLDRRG